MKEVFRKIIEAIERGLEIDLKLAIFQLLATVLLFVIVRIFLWKPITQYLEKRQALINKEVEEAKKANTEAQHLKSDIVKEYEAAKSETKKFKEVLQKEAYEEKARIITEARDEAKRRLDQVEFDVRQEVKKSNDKIRDAIKEIAFSAAEKIVQHEIDEDQHQQMIDELIDEKLR